VSRLLSNSAGAFDSTGIYLSVVSLVLVPRPGVTFAGAIPYTSPLPLGEKAFWLALITGPNRS
jgi:hypothetical protein